VNKQKRLLVLASGSPRRRELLGIGGFMFSVIRTDVDETPLPNENPRDYTLRVSEKKAAAALQFIEGEPLVVAADTTVAYQNKIYGKPYHAHHAEQMLKELRGRTHQVHTAIVVMDARTKEFDCEVATTDVPMRYYTDEEIAKYIASGDPFDKAGSYAIQNTAFRPVNVRTGCYANVIGLPLCHLVKILQRMDFPIQHDVPFLCQNQHEYECGVFTNILRTQDAVTE